MGLLLFFQLNAQVDSLKQAFEQQMTSAQNIDAFVTGDRLANRYVVENDIVNGKQHALELLDFVKADFTGSQRDSLMAIAYNQVAIIFGAGAGRPDEAISYIDSALVLMKEYEMWNRAAHAYSNKAQFLNRLSRYAEAVTDLIKAQNTILEHDLDGNESYILWGIYANLAVGYRNLAQSNDELVYARKSFESLNPEEAGNNDDVAYRLAYSYQIISIAHLNLKNLDSAKYNVKKGIAIFERMGMDQGLIDLYNTLATIDKDLKNFDEAYASFAKVEAISRKNNNEVGIAMVLINRGGMMSDAGQYRKGLNDMLKALPICLEMGDYSFLRVINYNIAEAYEKLGEFKSAMKYYKEYKVAEDSLNNQSAKAQLNDLNVKYETLEKESQLAEQELTLQTQEATIAAQNSRMIAIGGTAVVLLLIGTLYYNRSKAHQKAAYQTSLLTEKEKGLVAIVEATESERKRISKDLHDGIGQQLSALKLGLQSVKSNVSGEVENEINELTEQFSKSADEVRQISHQMMPRSLMENGLVEAMDGLLKTSFRYSEINYTYEHHGIEGRFDEKVEVSLYRILQELVNNVIKHSGASELSVQLVKSKARLMLLVEDNGRGLGKDKSDGHGLLNIKNRLDMINGAVNFEPSSNSGVLATVVVPV